MSTHDEEAQHSRPVDRIGQWLHQVGTRLTVLIALAVAAVLVPVVATAASASSVPPPPVLTGPGPVLASISGDAPNTTVGAPYSYQYTARYEEAATGCALAIASKDSLAPGLAFDGATCTWSGKATKAGTYTFLVTTANDLASITDTIVVAPATSTTAPVAKTTITGDAPNALVRLSYSFTYTTNSAKGCLSKVLGALPPGLTFDGATCTLSGIPTKTGSYRFIVVTADGRAFVTDSISVVLPNAPVMP